MPATHPAVAAQSPAVAQVLGTSVSAATTASVPASLPIVIVPSAPPESAAEVGPASSNPVSPCPRPHANDGARSITARMYVVRRAFGMASKRARSILYDTTRRRRDSDHATLPKRYPSGGRLRSLVRLTKCEL